jgi:hypothetical protein|tara:strand:- start:299 stop:601 length:303 start_codon:yes stop_codon:yes gene_type:complete
MLAVAVSVRHRDFEFGQEFTPENPSPDNVWELFGTGYRINPRYLVTDNDHEMIRLWRLFREGHLPESGGAGEQAAAMLDAFGIMSAAESDLASEIEETRR